MTELENVTVSLDAWKQEIAKHAEAIGKLECKVCVIAEILGDPYLRQASLPQVPNYR